MISKKILLIFATAISLSLISSGGDCGTINADEAVRKAAAFYENKKYDEAIAEYNKILDTGLESGNIYYDMGNCYFKKGELGRAILCYERARRLIPRDGDLKSNYEHALYTARQSVGVVPKGWFARNLENIFQAFTINGLTFFLSLLYLFGVLLILAGMYSHFVKRYLSVLLSVMTIIFLLGGFELVQRVKGIGKDSIVINKTVDVKYEPFESATTFYPLNEGDKVRVVSSKDSWRKVKRADGKLGWVKAESIEAI